MFVTIVEMNEEAKQLLESILVKNPEELTADEQGFLNARSWALNNEQKRIFASVLNPTQEPQQPAEEVAPEVTTPPEEPQQPEQPAEPTQEPQTEEVAQPTTPPEAIQEPETQENPYDVDPSEKDVTADNQTA